MKNLLTVVGVVGMIVGGMLYVLLVCGVRL